MVLDKLSHLLCDFDASSLRCSTSKLWKFNEIKYEKLLCKLENAEQNKVLSFFF